MMRRRAFRAGQEVGAADAGGIGTPAGASGAGLTRRIAPQPSRTTP
jgi:hypothetical protein